MRVVHPEYAHPLIHPVLHDALELFPQIRPILGLKIEWIDVLVLLGWVLGVLDRSIGAPAEPLGVFGHVGMIRCALECDVERELDAVLCRGCNQVTEILECAELRVDRLMPTLLRADGPGAARIIRIRSRGVVASLAEAAADGMNGRQIEHIEEAI